MGEDHVQRRRTHWWNRRRRCRLGNRCRRATSRNVTHHSFHPRERRWRRNYLPARPKRRIRKAQRTAYQLKIAALRKQLDQDVPVSCWSDRIREEPDGTLAVSFGSGSRNREQHQLHHSTFKVVNIWRKRRSKEKEKEQTSWSYWLRTSRRIDAMCFCYSILERKRTISWKYQQRREPA